MQPECPRCGRFPAMHGGKCWACGEPVIEVHIYTSTACLHGQHDYCRSPIGHTETEADQRLLEFTWPKKPAECKFCDAPCQCDCHH